MEEFSKAIASVGFPIAVAYFLLARLEKHMERLIKLIEGVGGVIDKLDSVLEFHKKRSR